MKEQIIKLRSEGKSYREIVELLGCSKGTVAYHCGKGQKEKNTQRTKKNRCTQVVCSKLDKFCNEQLKNKSNNFQRERKFKYVYDSETKTLKRKNIGKHFKKTFGYKDIIKKFGKENVKCYLTGRAIDLLDSKSYCFDHKIPLSKGGDNSFENLGITCKQANMAKYDMLTDEFIQLCKEVLEFNGYKVKYVENN